jgi:LPS export ABC transporter protein LptC
MSYFRPRNLLLVLALILAVILLAVIAMRYRPENNLRTIVKALPEGIDVSLQDIDYTHIEEGRARWRLVATQVERQAKSSILVVNSPQMTFYDEQREVRGSLQAVTGEVSEDYRKVQLNDEVVLKNTSGYTLYTDRLTYDHDTQTATTDALVRLESKGLHLQGRGLVFHVQTKQLQLKEQVEGVFEPE